MSKRKTEEGIKIVAQNKKARHEYFVESSLEAGMMLTGSEVKSLRDGRANLSDAYAVIDDKGECYLLNAHISPYPPAAMLNHEPKRTRKLLLHDEEIAKLMNKLNEKGYTIVPLKIYFKRGRAKVELGLCKGKRKYDKRETIKKRESDRELNRALKR